MRFSDRDARVVLLLVLSREVSHYVVACNNIEALLVAAKPRLALSIPPELDHVLRDISVISGVSASSFVSGLLVDLLPHFIQMRTALEQAQKSKLDAFDTLSQMIFQAQGQAAQAGLELGEMKRITRTRARNQNRVKKPRGKKEVVS